jgi:hypothetical protein
MRPGSSTSVSRRGALGRGLHLANLFRGQGRATDCLCLGGFFPDDNVPANSIRPVAMSVPRTGSASSVLDRPYGFTVCSPASAGPGPVRRYCRRPNAPPLLSLPPSLLPIALSGQRLLDSEFLSRLQVKSVSFDLPDDVFLQDFPFEAAERVFQRLAFLEFYLSQLTPPILTMIRSVAPPSRASCHCFSDPIIRRRPPS